MDTDLKIKEERLRSFFRQEERFALAFSGGVDSSYLLYAGLAAGADLRAFYVKTAFQPEFEYRDALKLSGELASRFPGAGAEFLTVLRADILSVPAVTKNPTDRCYYCKQAIFGNILLAAKEAGCTLVLDGTNASDDASDRPGMKALSELSVRSPLRECGLTKADIRALSKEAGLFTWDKPSYACLATRVPAGTKITEEILEKTESAEDYLFSLGFTDFRVRYRAGGALLQVKEAQLPLLFEKREEVLAELKKHYKEVMLDLKTR